MTLSVVQPLDKWINYAQTSTNYDRKPKNHLQIDNTRNVKPSKTTVRNARYFSSCKFVKASPKEAIIRPKPKQKPGQDCSNSNEFFLRNLKVQNRCKIGVLYVTHNHWRHLYFPF